MSYFRRIASAVLSLALGASALAGAAVSAQAAGPDEASPQRTTVELPITSYGEILVHDPTGRVFLTDRQEDPYGDGSFLVYDSEGEQVVNYPLTSPTGLALSPDGQVYVGTLQSIAAYDPATMEGHWAHWLGRAQCERKLVFTGGRLWYTHDQYRGGRSCRATTPALYWATGDESTGDEHHEHSGVGLMGAAELRTHPAHENKIFVGQPLTSIAANPRIYSVDVSTGRPELLTDRRFADEQGKGPMDLQDMALTPDGSRVAVADAAHGHRLLSTSDFADAPVGYQPLPEGATASAVDFSGDGTLVARGAAASGDTPDLLVQAADPANGVHARTYTFEGPDEGDRVVPGGLAWSQDGSRLVVVTTNAAGDAHWLHYLENPRPRHDSRFTGSPNITPGQPVVGEELTLGGMLQLDGPAPNEPVTVQAVREDADGTHPLPDAQVAADGTFGFHDTPSAVGEATYTVSFPGSATHHAAEDTSVTVTVGKAQTTLTLTAPDRARKKRSLEITGRLIGDGPALPDDAKVTVTRTDRRGTVALPATSVTADGTFRLTDRPRANGSTTYTVGYAGDALHTASTAEAVVLVHACRHAEVPGAGGQAATHDDGPSRGCPRT